MTSAPSSAPSKIGKRKPEEEEKDHKITKLTDIEHALHAADFYIGQTTHTLSPEVSRFVYNESTCLMEYRTSVYPQGLLKIFDEAIVNAADNVYRGTKLIKVGVNVLQNAIWVHNDGPNFSIEVTEHTSAWNQTEKAYTPEIAFFHCKTSSAYTKKQRITGGKFGLGAKLISIFSKWCTIEMCDGKTYYFQKCTDHMTKVSSPTIKPSTSKPYLSICYSPDLFLFYPENATPNYLKDDMIDLFHTRVLDLAGTLPKEIKVFWNLTRNQFIAPKVCKFERIAVKGFKEYIKLFLPAELKEDEDLKVGFHAEERWQVCMIKNPWPFPVNVSFVNNVNTYLGGEHVKYIQSQVYAFCKSKVDGLDIRRMQNNIMLFVNATIEDPSFNSQCKESLQTIPAAFGSTCSLPAKFFNVLSRNGVLDALKTDMVVKEMAVARREIGAGKGKPVYDIPDFRDARYAGGRQASKCTLYFVEGGSAMQLADVGISLMGSDYMGAFQLKGKVINADNSMKSLMNNAEFKNICRALGLQLGQPTPLSQLRYGKIVCLTDADMDGSHIRGLLIYIFYKFWPHLLKEYEFFNTMITPIVVARKNKEVKRFYTLQTFEEWSSSTDDKRWKIKYYKGLATSDDNEGKYYFKNLKLHLRNFMQATQDDFDALNMAIGKGNSKQRKEWLTTYDPKMCIPYESVRQVSIRDFIHLDYKHYSWLSVCRAIPSIEDGLTPAARKCTWVFLKNDITHEEKVSDLQSVIAKMTNYHHGSNSLGDTIVGMAQTFVGCQNLNLFYPAGQFGKRVDGGKTHGATRYLNTKLSLITKAIFLSEDEPILHLLEDEKMTIEPDHLLPVIPIALTNGFQQIGTGFCCNLPQYRPEDLINAIRRKLDNQPWQPLTPWYDKFLGEIKVKDEKGSFESFGVLEKKGSNIYHVTELPMQTWRNDYKEYLIKMMKDGKVSEFYENHKHGLVKFEITVPSESKLDQADMMKYFKLRSSFSSQLNLMTMDRGTSRLQIRQFTSIEEIFNTWFEIRLPFYEKRRQSILKTLKSSLPTLLIKIRFVRAVVDGELKWGRKKSELETYLADILQISSEYHETLFQMKLGSLTEERISKLELEVENKKALIAKYEETTGKDLWLQDLKTLEEKLSLFWKERAETEEEEEEEE